MMDLVQAKPQEKTVKWSFSEFFISSVFPIFCIELNHWLDLNIFSCCWMMTKHSPQAIFRDPFRRGNNILVSSLSCQLNSFGLQVSVSCCYTLVLKWIELHTDNFDWLGCMWYLHTSWWAYPHKQETCCCQDLQPSWCCCWSTMVIIEFHFIFLIMRWKSIKWWKMLMSTNNTHWKWPFT